MKLRPIALFAIALSLITILGAFVGTALIACGGNVEPNPEPISQVEPTNTQTQGLAGVYTSPIIGAFDGNSPEQLELPYGPTTGVCGTVYLSGHWAAQSVSDGTGASSTSIVTTIAADGNYLVTARIQNAGDEILTAMECLPCSAFSRGCPGSTGREGFGGVETTSRKGATANLDNPWTTVFFPMSFWGNSTGPHFVPNNINPPGVWVSGSNAGIALSSGSLVGAAYSDGTNESAIQYAGYSWSPSTCSNSLGRHSSGSCIYVPNGENAALSPVSPCDYCGVSNTANDGASSASCAPNANVTQCPGTNKKFCFISDVEGSFDKATGATGTIALTNTLSPVVGNFFSSSTSVPAPGGAISCIELAFN